MTEGRAESEQEGAWRHASLADANLRRPFGGSRASNAIGRLLPSGRSRRHVPNRVPLVLRLVLLALTVAFLVWGTTGVIYGAVFIPARGLAALVPTGLSAVLVGCGLWACSAMCVAAVIDHFDRRPNEEVYRAFYRLAGRAAAVLIAAGLVLSLLDSLVLSRQAVRLPWRPQQASFQMHPLTEVLLVGAFFIGLSGSAVARFLGAKEEMWFFFSIAMASMSALLLFLAATEFVVGQFEALRVTPRGLTSLAFALIFASVAVGGGFVLLGGQPQDRPQAPATGVADREPLVLPHEQATWAISSPPAPWNADGWTEPVRRGAEARPEDDFSGWFGRWLLALLCICGAVYWTGPLLMASWELWRAEHVTLQPVAPAYRAVRSQGSFWERDEVGNKSGRRGRTSDVVVQEATAAEPRRLSGSRAQVALFALAMGTVAMGYLAYAIARRRAWAVPCSIVLVAFVLRIGITGVAWNHLAALVACCLLLCATLLLLRHRLDFTLRVMMFVIGSLSAILATLSLHQ